MSTGVSQLYKSVIEDVITNVREAFLDEGVDEQILMELKQLWDNKLAQSKAVPPEGIHPEPERPLTQQFTIQTQHHQNTNVGMQVNAKNKSSKQLQQLPAGSVVQPVQYQYATGELPDASKTLTFTLPSGNQGKQLAIAIPAMHLQTPTGLVMSNPAAAAASALPPGMAAGLLQPSLQFNGGMITQQNSDGTTVQYQAVTAEQLAKQGFTLANMAQGTSHQQATTQMQQVQLANNGGIIQLDGTHDTSDEDDDDDDFKDDDNDQDDDNEQNEDENDAGGEEEDPLNSGDDVSDEEPTELFETENVIVCQYDKITRSRNKWKFHLKDGIMNLQGRDYVFQRASGDAEW